MALWFYWNGFYKKDHLGQLLPSHIISKEEVDSYLGESIEFFSNTYDNIRREFERHLR